MNLRRQLLLVSLLILVLPWAGCQFIRETETALREVQQQMLSGTAQAIADSLSQHPGEFALQREPNRSGANQLYGHPLSRPPVVDGYFDDWPITRESMRKLRGTDGSSEYVVAIDRQHFYLFVDARDANVIYRNSQPGNPSARHFDRVSLISAKDRDNIVAYDFEPEAPGPIVPTRLADAMLFEESRILAHWQDTVGGFRLEARIPKILLSERIGLVVTNTSSANDPGIRSASFAGDMPGPFVTRSQTLQIFAEGYAQSGMRLIITDRSGWRLALAGGLSDTSRQETGDEPSGWLRLAYAALQEPGDESALSDPDPSGREQQVYVDEALAARSATSWYRSTETGRAVVVIAQPVWSGNVQTGAIILQKDNNAILSLTNQALARLISFTLIATVVLAAGLLGYASWLSLRIRRLSSAAELALDDEQLRAHLPSETAHDEIGDLSRSFSSVLQQLGDYNQYLRTLASKLSHELRTPLTIVSSSLENLEHEDLSVEASEYTARARDGADRLRKILRAMSEANRVEELMQNSEPDRFRLDEVLSSTVAAYSSAWPERRFVYEGTESGSEVLGSPELLVQMLDKLVDNAVDFTAEQDTINVSLVAHESTLTLQVSNPGQPLPEQMRARLFDSMVSVRGQSNGKHLGLGLHIVRLIAEGHAGSVSAENTDEGVSFRVELPSAPSESPPG
jgi:two-component system sensor histidine kinase ChvG